MSMMIVSVTDDWTEYHCRAARGRLRALGYPRPRAACICPRALGRALGPQSPSLSPRALGLHVFALGL